MALRHLSWADNRLFSASLWQEPGILRLPGDGESRTIADLLLHIARGAQWYRYCLTGEPLLDLVVPLSSDDVYDLGIVLVDLDATLTAEADLPDTTLVVEEPGKTLHVTRSMLLAQACYHSTEHRTQIDAALRIAGHPGLELDSYDLWNFTSL
jgi:uncharacterized damage-inducible protein DinB